MERFAWAAASMLALAACSGGETVSENLMNNPDAGGAAEVGPPIDANAADVTVNASSEAELTVE